MLEWTTLHMSRLSKPLVGFVDFVANAEGTTFNLLVPGSNPGRA
jgi:hypothetical protein